ncbi:MAG: hypothetical protein R2991_13105 [Thermoanaerobaculia bacterium]
MTSIRHWKLALLLLLGLLHLGAALFVTPAGHLSIDEVTYDLMCRNLAAGRGVEIANGDRERPSPELAIASLVVARGRLVAMPPPLFPLLVYPGWTVLGWRGAFVLNALAFCGTLACTWLLARALWDAEVASNATLVLGLATFLPDYAQAGWPHALTTFLLTAALLVAFGTKGPRRRRGGDGDGDRMPLRRSLVAGLLLGLATGVRLDAVFLLPGLLLGFCLLERPVRRIVALLVGLAPGLAALAWVNHLKFGSWSPFTYGATTGGLVAGPGPYLGVAVIGTVTLGIVAMWLRVDPGHRRAAWALTLAGGIALVAVAPSRDLLASCATGFAQLVVDLRLRPLGIVEPVLERTASGALLYAGGLKKAMLQSCPFLILVPAALIGLRKGDRRPLVALLPTAGFVGVYSAFAWHGGMSLNLRYWTPALPLLALLVAVAMRELGLERRLVAPLLGALGCAALLGPVLRLDSVGPAALEPWLLSAPLCLALLLAATALGARRLDALRAACALLLGAALTWGALTTHLYDLLWSARQRASTVRMAAEIGRAVPAGSLLVSPFVVGLGSLAGRGGRVVADPTRDGFEDAVRLARDHLARGRPVLGLMDETMWRRWLGTPEAAGLERTRLWARGGVVLGRVESAGSRDRSQSPAAAATGVSGGG